MKHTPEKEYEFTIFASVKARLRQHLKAPSQEEACRKLLKEIYESTGSINLHRIYDDPSPGCGDAAWVEQDEDQLAVLVDEVGDREFNNSNYYGFNGEEPVQLTPDMPMYGVEIYLRQRARIKELADLVEEFLADQGTMNEPYRNEAICERARAVLAKKE